MYLDGRTAEVPDLVTCDIAIVGAGPAGITLASELNGAGLDTVLIESGGLDFDTATQELFDGEVTGLDSVDLTAIRLRLFGGASGHWGGQCLPLDEIDFDRAPPGLTGWPFGLAELMPHYETACRYCEVGPADFDPVTLGVDAARQPLAEDANVTTAVIRQSGPTRFGETYRDSLGRQANLRILLWTNVTGAEIDPEGHVTALTTGTLEGRVAQVRARHVVIACGAVETARLLLQINADLGRRYGDAGGLLGRCYMDHPSGGAGVIHLQSPVETWPYWDRDLVAADGHALRAVLRPREELLAASGRLNAQFFLTPLPPDAATRERQRDARRGIGALRDIAKWGLGRGRPGLSLTEAYCTAILSTDALVADAVQSWRGDAVTKLFVRYEAEQLPNRDNFVALGQDRDALGQFRTHLHWAPSLSERDSLVENAVMLGAAFGARGLGHLELTDEFETPTWQASTAWHQMGTTRMSLASKDGVTDPNGRVHGTDNLYCLGSGLMPTGGRANPTLTIVALAARMAGHLRAKAGG